MALFRKGEGGASANKNPARVPTTPTTAYCRICAKPQKFTRCWRRMRHVDQCECCGLAFENPAALYKKWQPVCPKCAEFLEQPTFEYGLCDGCGSKYELVAGTPPGLLPNAKQREEMNKHGRARSLD